ncbi:MAG: hypothetical protein ACXWZI_12015, partial [Mycobacterium sp.]
MECKPVRADQQIEPLRRAALERDIDSARILGDPRDRLTEAKVDVIAAGVVQDLRKVDLGAGGLRLDLGQHTHLFGDIHR